MLIELIETDLNLHLLLALGLGLVFGVAAQITRFCLRRAVAGEPQADRSAGAVWLMALGVAVGGFAVLQSMGLIDLTGHRYVSANLPVAAILIGGLLFGAGMVLTRGCVSRLTVLSASGNLRAATVLLVFAVVAHAAMRGVLSPVRTTLGSLTVDAPIGSLAALPGLAPVASLALVGLAVYLARGSGLRWTHLALGALIGLVAVAGWSGTSVLFFDEFDPAPVQSLSFTQPWSDTLFWVIISTAVPAGFGVGLIGGVLVGSFLSAALRGELALQGFEGPSQMLRYGAGGAMMGLGAVLAGGCSVGAGLAGGASLGISALLALAAMIAGALAMRLVLQPRGRGALA